MMHARQKQSMRRPSSRSGPRTACAPSVLHRRAEQTSHRLLAARRTSATPPSTWLLFMARFRGEALASSQWAYVATTLRLREQSMDGAHGLQVSSSRSWQGTTMAKQCTFFMNSARGGTASDYNYAVNTHVLLLLAAEARDAHGVHDDHASFGRFSKPSGIFNRLARRGALRNDDGLCWHRWAFRDRRVARQRRKCELTRASEPVSKR